GDVADDVVQDVFMKLVSSLSSYDLSRGQFRAFLQLLVHRCVMNVMRRHHASLDSQPGLADALDPSASPDSEVAAEERRIVLRRAIDMLPEKERQVLLATYFENRNTIDVAASLGLPVASVYRLRYRAMARLRQELEGLLDVPEE